jgi:hypothetical protein
VRGDAILLQFKKSPFHGTPMGSNKLVDFGMELWDMHYGKSHALFLISPLLDSGLKLWGESTAVDLILRSLSP